MLTFPETPLQSPLSIARRPVLRETPLGEELGARVRQGFEESFIGQAIEDALLPEAPRALTSTQAEARSKVGKRVGYMSEESYKASPLFREGVEWDERMTPERAEALAEIVDKRNYRNSLIERSPGGVGRAVLGFGASLVGAAPDPVNYIPIFGPAARALAVARLGRIGGRVALGTGEGAVGAALVSPYVAQNINRKGGDIGAADVAMDIALSAVLGGAFGAGAGVIDRRRAARALRQDGAKREVEALAKAAEDLADDLPVDVRGLQASKADFSARLKTAAARIQGDRLAEEIVLPSTQVLTRTGREVTHNGPMDLVTWLRSQQGIQDSGGELRSRDLTEKTKARTGIDYVGREAHYGPLVDNANGMSLDDAALRAWEAGYFPDKMERPTPDDLLRAIDETIAAGGNLDRRRFAQSDMNLIDRLRQQRDEADIAAENAEMEAQAAARDGEALPANIADDPAEVTARGEADLDFALEAEAPLEDIPYFREADAEIRARSTERSEFAGVSRETDQDPILMEIDEMRKAGELDEADEAALREVDDFEKTAESYAVGYETLAGCVIRHG